MKIQNKLYKKAKRNKVKNMMKYGREQFLKH